MQLTAWFLRYSMFTTHSLIAAVVLNHSYKTALITYCGTSKILIILVPWIKIQYVQDWNQLKWKYLEFYNHFNTNYLRFQCVLYKNLETLWVHFVFRFFNWNLHPCSAFVCFVLFLLWNILWLESEYCMNPFWEIQLVDSSLQHRPHSLFLCFS